MLDTAKIKRLRERRGLTQLEAAVLAGLKVRQAWNRIEAGRNTDLRLSSLAMVAKALGVKPKDLLR